MDRKGPSFKFQVSVSVSVDSWQFITNDPLKLNSFQMLRLLNQNSQNSTQGSDSGKVPRGIVRAPSTDNNSRNSKSTPDLDAFFRKHKLSNKLKKNLKSLGITSLDQLLRMKDKQILMYGNFDGFDKSLSSELILLTGALDEHRKQSM